MSTGLVIHAGVRNASLFCTSMFAGTSWPVSMMTFWASGALRNSIALMAAFGFFDVRDTASPLPKAVTACCLPRQNGAMPHSMLLLSSPLIAQNPVVLTAILPCANAASPLTSAPKLAYCFFVGTTPCLFTRSPAHCSASTTGSLVAAGRPLSSMILPPFWYTKPHHAAHHSAPAYPHTLPGTVSALNASSVCSQVQSAVGASSLAWLNMVLL
jgi:hypothetical protein